jgi:hypothetical protein
MQDTSPYHQLKGASHIQYDKASNGKSERWTMKKLLGLCFIAVFMISIVACGGGDNPPPRVIFVAEILSDQPADGDIAYDPFRKAFTITNGPGTLFFGIDDLDRNLPEYRAFLDFPLDGSTGQDVVPADAVIVSATLEVFVKEASFATVIPTLLDLVPYPVSGLRPQDFDSPPLVFQRLNFFRSDQGKPVAIDVTPLMREAQRLGLSDFQVRLLLDLAVSNVGFVGVDDRPNISITAPLLTVEYE